MKRSLIVLGLVAAIGGAVWVGLFYWFCWHREPTYQGRSLSEWLDAETYGEDAWWPGRYATFHAVQAMGTNAVPFLLERFSRPPQAKSVFNRRVSGWMYQLKLHKLAHRYYDNYGQERLIALMTAFDALRPYANEVVPMLIEIAKKDGTKQVSAMHALGMIGSKEGLPFFLEGAASTNDLVRQAALWDVGYIHADAINVVPTLVKGLHDPSLLVRTSAAHSLADFGPQAQQALPDLSRMLDEENEIFRSDLYSGEHRTAREAAEYALAKIRTNEITVPNSTSPRIGSGPAGTNNFP